MKSFGSGEIPLLSSFLYLFYAEELAELSSPASGFKASLRADPNRSQCEVGRLGGARVVRKVTTGITDCWQSSVHSDVAF